MDDRLEKLLRDEFPSLYARSAGAELLPYHLFGFEVGNGWFRLIYTASKKLTSHCEATGLDIRVNQIKEKYGLLRIYLSSYTDEADKIIDEAENASSQLCEVCGRPGKLKTKGWRFTACPDHTANKSIDLEPIILEMLSEVPGN